MPATEHDSGYERWLQALNGLQEVSGQYQLLLRSMQNGFHTLSLENAAIRQRLTQIEVEFRAMHATFQELLPHMATIAAYVVTQRQQAPPPPSPQPQERQRQTRRPNGG